MRKKVHISALLLLPALDSLILKLATCQYFTRDNCVSLATFSGNSFFTMIWLANFQLADLQLAYSQICNSQTRKLADSQLARYQTRYIVYNSCVKVHNHRNSQEYIQSYIAHYQYQEMLDHNIAMAYRRRLDIDFTLIKGLTHKLGDYHTRLYDLVHLINNNIEHLTTTINLPVTKVLIAT